MKSFKPFNLNDYIKVKLTDFGRQIHRQSYDNLVSRFKTPPFPYSAPVEDENGWSSWQAWEFMQIFGGYFRDGLTNPCETSIYIQDGL